MRGCIWRISLRRMQSVDVYGTIIRSQNAQNKIVPFPQSYPFYSHDLLCFIIYLEYSPRSPFIASSVDFAALGVLKPFATANSVACAFRLAYLTPISASRTSTRTTVPFAARTCSLRGNHHRTCLADTLFTPTVSENSRDSTTVARSVKRLS
jgi:hypothetical protein